MSNRFYEALGRATWAIGKHKVKQKVSAAQPAARYLAAGAAVVGIAAVGALVARSGSTD
ncbi:MAG: hypothetical protein WAO61_03115 [Solirubrobacterales bacterium]